MTDLTWLETGPLALLLRASAILVLALVLHRALRKGPAISRHALWSTVMVCLLALPLLHVQLPTLAVPGWRAVTAPAAQVTGGVVGASFTGVTAMPSPGIEPHREAAQPPLPVNASGSPVPWTGIVTLAWFLGGLAVLVPVVVGIRRAGRFTHEAMPVTNRRMLARLEHLRRVVGVSRRVALKVSEAVRTPMAWGSRHPVILLPMDAAEWDVECFDAVLVHELVHLRHRDPVHQCLARLASACYWFHPIMWQGARLAAAAREQACDDAVLRFGTRPSHYARHLMALAEHGTTMQSMPALARLHHPNLEDRIMTILRHAPARHAPWRTALAVATVATWTLAVAAVGPATAQSPPPLPAAPPMAPTAATPPAVSAPSPAPARSPRAAGVLTPPPVAPMPSVPAAPAPPPVPPVIDCARGANNGVVVQRSDAPRSPTRTVFRNLDNGGTICLAIRGALGEEFPLSPLASLPRGVVLTLESTLGPKTQRMEITGNGSSNTHSWWINGQARPLDAEAHEWRDAMLSVLSLGMEKSRVRTAAVAQRSEVTRRQAERTIAEARALTAVQARDVREQAARVHAQASRLSDQARVARAQRDEMEVAAERVHEEALRLEAERPARVDERRLNTMRERAVIQERQVRDQEVAVAEVAERVRRSADDLRVAERALVERARVMQDRSDRIAAVASERALEPATRVRAAESPRVREIDTQLEPLERRLMEIIGRIGPR